jgi:peptidoglycan/xylan/chitin deacetylase (PgdA/CDA1 family)
LRRFLNILGAMLRPSPRPLILMYHRIANAPLDFWGLAVSPDRFESHLVTLKERRRVLPLRRFVELHRENRLPANAAAITFDDGTACNALVAAPLLQTHGLPATFFLTTDAMETGREFWWDELARLVFETLPDVVRDAVDAEGLGHDFQIEGKSVDGSDATAIARRGPYGRAYIALWQALKRLDAVERTALLDRLWQRSLGRVPAPRSSHRPMTLDEARRLATGKLVEIGAHTVTHPALSGLDLQRQRIEITVSKAVCEDLTQTGATSFAYPHGDFDEATIGLVRDAGFDLACTTEQSSVRPGTDRFMLPRLQVRNWSAGAFSWALKAASAGRPPLARP